jgi:death on curing protein
MSDDPIWITVEDTLAMHERLLEEHGGAAGVRDVALLESALGRVRQHFAYGESDLFVLAATLAHSLANNHPFIDGNKRVAFVMAAIFLETNAYRITAPEEQAVVMTLGLADKSITADHYAQWLRENSSRRD